MEPTPEISQEPLSAWGIVLPLYSDAGVAFPESLFDSWETMVAREAGGVTQVSESQGRWHNHGDEYIEKNRLAIILCHAESIEPIIQMTGRLFGQHTVICFRMSDEARVVRIDQTGPGVIIEPAAS